MIHYEFERTYIARTVRELWVEWKVRELWVEWQGYDQSQSGLVSRESLMQDVPVVL